MKFTKPFLLVTEATPGLNTHASYASIEEATRAKDETFADEQDPICIFNLNTMEYIWENDAFPAYGETIANSIITSYIKGGA